MDMTQTVKVDVEGLTCHLCIGDVLERIHDLRGVSRVSVGPVHDGRSTVLVTGDPAVNRLEVEAAMAHGRFHVVDTA
jgi:copper chaperone CopZ